MSLEEEIQEGLVSGEDMSREEEYRSIVEENPNVEDGEEEEDYVSIF